MPVPELIGTYIAPTCKRGDWLDDEIDGRTQVGGWTDAPLPWPRRLKTGRPSLILTAELARAVRTESVAAIRYWWGVGATTVWTWRRALGVGRITTGTRQRLQERTGVPPDAAARGRRRAASPESRAKMSATKRGAPAAEATKAALLRAAKRRKLPGWGVRANAWMLGRELPEMHSGEWTAAEETYLTQHYPIKPVASIATALGRTYGSVQNKAVLMRLPSPRRRWSAQDDDYLREHYTAHGAIECAAHLARTIAATRTRARFLGLAEDRPASLGVEAGPRRWSAQDDDMLRRRYRTTPAPELARELRRSVPALRSRAHALGLTKV